MRCPLDKYEYNIKSDQIKKLYNRRDFAAAARIADQIDWRRVKDNTMISRVADIYENNKEYEKAKATLLIAYERSPMGRQLAYRLTVLSLRTKDFVEADEFYRDFVEMSPMDVAQYILKYRISKAKGEDIEVLIQILEAYVAVEKDERWQYELAKLYHEAGYEEKCVSMCNDIMLWFNDGKYADKALALKELHKDYVAKKETKKHTESYEVEEILRALDIDSEGKTSSETVENSKELEVQGEAMTPMSEPHITNQQAVSTKMDAEPEQESNSEAETMNAALEAIRAAELAAQAATKAAEQAKKLALEAQMKAKAAEMAALREEYKNGFDMDFLSDESSAIYQSLSGVEEETESVEESKDVIEIFEFDAKKDGKCNNIGEELTKTAEIDIDEINLQLEPLMENSLVGDRIQNSLKESMEHLMEAELSNAREVRDPFDAIIEYEEQMAKMEADSKEEIPQGKTKVIDRVAINRALDESLEPVSNESEELAALPEQELIKEVWQPDEILTEQESIEGPWKSVENIPEQEQVEGVWQPTENISEQEQEEEVWQSTENIPEQESVEKVTELPQIPKLQKSIENISQTSEAQPESELTSGKQPEPVKEQTATEPTPATNLESTDLALLHQKKLPEPYCNMFGDFTSFEGMEELIAETLENLIFNFVADGTSARNNVIISGKNKIGKTTLGLSIIKSANRGRNRAGRRVAKVKASVLNKRGVATAMAQIIGTDLIIEQAGSLAPNTAVDLMNTMSAYTEEMLIILEDDKAGIDRLVDSIPKIKEYFGNRLDIPEFEIRDLVKVAQTYALRENYEIDGMGMLALHAKLDEITGKNQGMTFEEVEEVVDDAIEHSKRMTIGKLIGKLKKNKSNMSILTEEDFL